MTTADPTPPRTPAEALQMAADMAEAGMPLAIAGRLRRWADELDTAPAVYALPAEPPGNSLVWVAEGLLSELRRWLPETGLIPSEDLFDLMELLEQALQPHREAVASRPTEDGGTVCIRCGLVIDPLLTAQWIGPDSPRHGTCPSPDPEAQR